MSYKIVFHEAAVKDLEQIDNSVRILVIKQLKKLQDNPYLGIELGNKGGMNLVGYRKLYVMKKKIRIVYKIIEKKLVVFIVTIAKRDKGEAY